MPITVPRFCCPVQRVRLRRTVSAIFLRYEIRVASRPHRREPDRAEYTEIGLQPILVFPGHVLVARYLDGLRASMWRLADARRIQRQFARYPAPYKRPRRRDSLAPCAAS